MIVTFGPDGDTGHPDHRIVGDVVTELILREAWYGRYPVYYLGWTKEQAAKFGIEELNYLDKRYFNAEVRFSAEDKEKYFRAIRCHESQNLPQEVEEWVAAERKDTTNVLYFRRFVVDMVKRSVL
ncbi:MAG: hypothetical protein JST68_12370 [Bacteroidetes bacterium]|nr:hypothetical protein [Bacteroidota bacterium]